MMLSDHVSLINFLNTWTIFFLIACLMLRIYRAYKNKFIDFVFALSLAGIISEGLKYIINRPRPEISFIYNISFEGAGFPSTHTTIAFTAAFFFLFACHALSKKNRGAGDIYFAILGLFLASVVAILRILTHAHYSIDIFAGISLGFLIPLIFIFYDVRIKKIK